MTEHRVPMLGLGRRYPDPENSTDPTVSTLVTALATLPSPPPRAHFRAELRAQLVAVTPRLVAEAREEHAATPAPRRAPGRAGNRGRVPLRIAAGVRVGIAALAVCALLLGSAVWLSRSALPGDTLYSLKRAGETAQLALATDTRQRAEELLSFAKTRADEVGELLAQPSASAAGPQADGGISASRASLVRSTLAAADDDLRQASQLLGNQAVQTRSGAPLDTLLQWTPGQQQRLAAIVARIPQGDLRQNAQQSADLVAAAAARANALQSGAACACAGGSGSDALGPLPCGPCRTDPARPAPLPRTSSPHRPAPAQPQGTASPQLTTPPASSSDPAPGASDSSGASPSSPAGTTSGGLLPLLPLPPLPLPTVITIIPPLVHPSDSCTPVLQLGPISVGCGVTLRI